jgi:hypothetical protein
MTKKGETVIFAYVIDGYNMGMIQGCGGAGFTQETGAQVINRTTSRAALTFSSDTTSTATSGDPFGKDFDRYRT